MLLFVGRRTGGNASQVCIQDKNLQASAVEVSIGFSATLWFIVLFTPALRRHYIPLCLLENHYGAIKSNVVLQTNMGFYSVSHGWALPWASCDYVPLWWSRDPAVEKTLNRWQWQRMYHPSWEPLWHLSCGPPSALVCKWLLSSHSGLECSVAKLISLQKWRKLNCPYEIKCIL